MAEADQAVRLRHYTRKGSKNRILQEARLLAKDQNKVFVEPASHKPLSPRAAAWERHPTNPIIRLSAFEFRPFQQGLQWLVKAKSKYRSG